VFKNILKKDMQKILTTYLFRCKIDLSNNKGGTQMAMKSSSIAKFGTWGINPAVRFNGTCLSDTNIKDTDKVKIEYHKDKIVIRKAVK